ncbi:MAG: Rpn family recombination-promoting nuclease/putative transposase [Lachnobacterium sp.]|nr:Rpn family recombination-promoting nuclease/putative transposase [Lachnobacterium sp.]
MNTEIANAVNAAGDKAQYDTRVKRLLAQKSILAHILVKIVDEFKGMKPEDVVKYIEGEPSISVVPVEPGLANMEKTDATGQRIVGLNTENAEINEGLVRFDIIFYVRMKNGLSQIIVNIEAQKDEPTEYKILNRAIFYVSRLISSQKERDFVNTNYDDIKQVFSIWICMNMDDNSLSHIHLTKDEMLKPYNWKGNLDLLNIVLIGITNEIPEHDEKYEMHRLIGALLSSELKEQEKLDIIEHEYNIPISQEFREDVRIMCNLSTGIEERATEKTSEKFILNMYKKGYTLDQIADVAETGVDEVEAIIKKREPAMA